MKNFKKILSVLMVILLVTTAVPLSSFVGIELPAFDLGIRASAKIVASSGSCGDNVTYTYNNSTGELVISGTGPMYDYDVYNPTFYDSAIKSVVIGDGVTSIGSRAFQYCRNLTSIAMPDSVTTIGVCAFQSCRNLKSITIPDSVTTIRECAFQDTEYYNDSSNWENNTLYIDEYLIECTGFLGDYIVNEGTKVIADYAFDNCDGLTSVTIPDSVATIGYAAFYSCNSLTSISVDTNNAKFSSDSNGVLFNKNKSNLIQYPMGKVNSSYIIPYGVRTIGDYAFSNYHPPLDIISIGDGETTICDSSSENLSGLENVTIPDSVITIGDYAFYYCNTLSSITIGNGVTFIGKSAFENCNGLETVTIPDSVVTIGDYAFRMCHGLISVIISDSLKTIGKWAFSDCSRLTSVSYIGTEEQWAKINIDTGNECLTSTTLQYIPKHKHSYTLVEILKDATHLEYGVIAYTCECGDSYTDKIAKLEEHTYESVVTKPTCSSEGYTTYSCLCGDSYIDDYIEVITHKYNEERVQIEEGTEYYSRFTCEFCGDMYTVIDPAKKLEGFVVSGQTYKIVLSWLKAVEASVTGYRIYRRSEDETEYTLYETINDRSILSYTDKNVELDKLYYYQICAMKNNVVGVISDELYAIPLHDVENPNIKNITPASYSILSGKEQFAIEADDDIGVVKIELYYSADDGATWNLLDYVDGSSFNKIVDISELQNTKILVKAIAYDKENNISKTDIERIYRVDNIGPEKVKNVRVIKLYASSLTLAWDDISDADYKHFIVELKKENGFERISEINSLGYNVKNLKPNSEYTFRIAAVDSYNNIGEYSDDFVVKTKADTQNPIITSICQAARCKNSVRFSATAEDDCGISKIIIETSQDGTIWKSAKILSFDDYLKSKTISTDIDLSDFDEGLVKIRAIAYDNSGNSNINESKIPYTEFLIDRTSPSVPQDVKAIPYVGCISITWDMGSEEDISTYRLYRSTNENGKYELIANDLKTTTYFDRSTQKGYIYYYKVLVEDTVGNISDYSQVVSAVMIEDNEKPIINSIVAKNESSLGETFNEISIFASDNNSLDRVIVEVKKGILGNFEILEETSELSGKSDGYIYVNIPVSDFTDGDIIYVRAKAIDISGIESDYSNVFKYKIDKTAPQIKDASVEIVNGKLTVTWKNNGEGDLAGYRVFLQINDGEKSQIATRSANSNEYVLTKTVVDTGCYKVDIAAYDVVGNSSFETIYCTMQDFEIAPVAVIESVSEFEVGVEEYFDATESFDFDGNIFSFYWEFGDGTTSSKARFAKSYSAPGDYDVTLKVVDNDGLMTTQTKTISVFERRHIGTLKVTVIDENGFPVPYVPVKFGLGEEKTVKYFTDANGVAIIKGSAGKHNVGVYSDGELLPVQRTAILIGGATTSLTIRASHGSVVEGDFEITRMTADEVKEAGIDISQTANNQVYSASVVVSYGSGSYQVNYKRAGNKILDFDYIDDSDDNLEFEVKLSSGERKPVSIVSIPTSDETECIAIIDVPARISYLKECFDVQLHILNNATTDFHILESTVNLYLPDGLSLINNVYGYENSSTVDIPIINTREKTIRWMIRGDKEGEYDLTADFAGTISIFEEPVTAIFKTDEPIKVYGSKAVDFTYDFDSQIRYGAFYFNVGMKNKSPIDIMFPNIGLTEDGLTNISKIMEAVEKEDGKNKLDNETALDQIADYSNISIFELGLVLEDETGFKKYLAEMPEVLAPGQKLYKEYVSYGLADVNEVGYFNDAVAFQMRNDDIDVVTNCVEMSHYGLDDPIVNFENIHGKNKETDSDSVNIKKAYDYITTNDNFMYWNESALGKDGLIDEIIEETTESARNIYDSLNFVLNLDFKSVTDKEVKDTIRSYIGELMASESFMQQINRRIEAKYAEVVNTFVGKISGILTTEVEELAFVEKYYDENNNFLYEETIIEGPFNNLVNDSANLRSMISQLKNKNGENIINENKFSDRLFNVIVSSCGAELTKYGREKLRELMFSNVKINELVSESFAAVSNVADIAGDAMNLVKNVSNAYNKSVEIYNTLIVMKSVEEESIYLLDVLIDNTKPEKEKPVIWKPLLGSNNDYSERIYGLINSVCSNLKEDIQKNIIHQYDIFVGELATIYANNMASDLAKKAINKVIKDFCGNPYLLLYKIAGGIFNLLDYLFKFGDTFKLQDKLQLSAIISDVVLNESLVEAEKYKFDSFDVDNYNTANKSLTMLKYTIVSRIIGQRFFYEYAELLEKKIAVIDKQIADNEFAGLSEEERMKKIEELHTSGCYESDKASITDNKGIVFEILSEILTDLPQSYTELYRSELITILQARDIIFNSKTTITTVPEAPKLTLDYYNLRTVQSFSDEYQYCFGDGEWKKCNFEPISFTVKRTAQILRVRKIANGTELSGNIATVIIYPKPVLMPQLNIKYDGDQYLFENLEPKYTHEVILTDNVEDDFESSDEIHILKKGIDSLPVKKEFSFAIIRISMDEELQVFYSDKVTRMVEKTVNMNIKAEGEGIIEGERNRFNGQIVNLRAVPKSGYKFIGWYLEDVFAGVDEQFSFVAYENANLKAVFAEVLVEEIILSQSELELNFGDIIELNAVVSPNDAFDKTLYWTSSDESVAIVNNKGVVTAISEGVATITVETKHKVFAGCNIIVKHYHEFSKWNTVIKSTCIAEGVESRQCYGCKVVEERKIPLVTHIYNEVEVAPTCTKGGYKEFTCSACNYMYKTNETAKLGHDMSDFVTTLRPSCEEKGIQISKCSRCNYSETKNISATEHNYKYGVCDNCGHSKADNCSHMCHKNNFIWKIIRLFFKLFKIQPTCECGARHY